MSADPFSFSSIPVLSTEKCATPKHFSASDGAQIAYFEYLPEQFDTRVVLIHGGGAHSCAGYQYLSRKLQASGIAVYAMDLRGHGASGGVRGHTENVDLPYNDLNIFLGLINQKNSGRLVLLGHSSGAGFLLNYSGFSSHLDPDRYVFVAPEFGYKSETARESSVPFAKARLWVFIAGGFSGGRAFKTTPAVEFSYPENILTEDPRLLRFLTRNMALSVTPSDPGEQLSKITSSVRILIGSEDEVIDPGKLSSFAGQQKAHVEVLPGTTHLSILERIEDVRRAIVP